MDKFIGRKEELKLLKGLFRKNSASLVVIYGRRRVGKSRLIEEFGRGSKTYSFAGLAPELHTTTQSQLDEFAKQMYGQFGGCVDTFKDWGDAFSKLATQTQNERSIILLDEITWLGNCDPDFLGKLKHAWDTAFKKNPQLILVICGSVSSWINTNILSNTGFYGRISLKLHIRELPMEDCNEFWEDTNISPYEKLKILAVTGGIPKYLEEIRPELSAEENIKQLCFLESGMLFSDFNYIFLALLQRDSAYYAKIISLLDESSLEQNTLTKLMNIESGGFLSSYLQELVISGFIERDYSWNIKTGEVSRLSKYRLTDNYLRFYTRYIQPNIHKIHNGQFQNCSLSSLAGYSSLMGLQVENLVLNNRNSIKKQIGIYPDEVIFDNPYFQRATTRHKGCQIDYMIQTKFGNLYVCEIKFSRNIIRKDIIDEVQEKISRLSAPKNFSIRPVLIHASEVHDEVLDSNYFAKIVDLTDSLKN